MGFQHLRYKFIVDSSPRKSHKDKPTKERSLQSHFSNLHIARSKAMKFSPIKKSHTSAKYTAHICIKPDRKYRKHAIFYIQWLGKNLCTSFRPSAIQIKTLHMEKYSYIRIKKNYGTSMFRFEKYQKIVFIIDHLWKALIEKTSGESGKT